MVKNSRMFWKMNFKADPNHKMIYFKPFGYYRKGQKWPFSQKLQKIKGLSKRNSFKFVPDRYYQQLHVRVRSLF